MRDGAAVRYRRARPEDAPAMQAVVQRGFEGYRAIAPPSWEPPDQTTPEAVARARVELGAPETFSVVAEAEGRIAGHITLVRADAPSPDGFMPDQHLRHLFVLEPYWGGGVARTLHARMLERVRGVARLYTPAEQAEARRFYEREGWRLAHGPWTPPDLGLALVEYRLRRPR